ncbi:TIGR03089 family protein [Streptomyces zhaozhouensis]|uniref:TIGR03089 family protein n=1 Tax=Streptomyces zhaozhouensis TaxID=1300267 RepID=A0A286E2N3_9ACTN|nr:TIGR03089 family protein [Streptomyces zhaozhouensis]SOD65157.1 TIGR03089 family protein [Streptomyces zhaozhouensis]
MNTADRTPADLLRSALASDAGRPLLTYYDDATGERVELSAATLANWVAKTSNLLQDELAAARGERLALLLPAHWQTAVWLLACAATGVVAEVDGDPADADLVVCGPDRIEEARACTGERVALALRPLGGRFPEAPAGFSDYALVAPGQGDTFAALDPPGPDDPALVVGGAALTGGELLARARADAAALDLGPGCRLMSTRGYGSWEGLSAGLFAPLAVGGSVVLCRNADRQAPEALAARRESERVTHFAD